MNKGLRRFFGLVAGMILMLGAQAFAVETTQADAKAQEAAMMEKMKQLGAPSQAHQVFEPFVGKWAHTVTWQMAPDAKPEQSVGTNENTWIMDGRFLRQDVQGQAMGAPFKGLGVSGYDNVRGEYTSVWIDNMGTGMMTATGSYDPATQTIRESGQYPCPMTGEKDRWFRAEWKWVDANHYLYEMYSKAPDGKEFKSMVVAYERQE